MKKSIMNIKLCLGAIALCIGINTSAQISLVKSITCHGLKDGQLEAQPRFGVAPYSFLWSTGSTKNVIKGLGAGTYTVTITDNASISNTYTYTLSEPNLISNSFTVTPNALWAMLLGNPVHSGSIKITATTGGNGGFSYSVKDSTSRLTDTTTSTTIGNLASGTYFIKTTDTEGCYRNDTVRVTEFAGYQQLGAKPLDPDTTACYKDVASTSIQPDTANVTFPVRVYFDNKLFKTIYGYTRTADTLNMYRNSTTPVTMHGITSKNILLYITDTVAITSGPHAGSDSALVFSASVSNSFKPGFHIMEVYTADGKGLRYSWDVDSVVAPVSINFIQTNDVCFGDTKGAITAKAQGSYQDYNKPYTYTISGPAGFTTVASSSALGLGAGVYTITATDWAGCLGTQTVTVTQPSEPMSITFDVTKQAKCPYSVDGEITIHKVDGSTYPLTYQWSNGATTQAVNNLQAGTYTATVTDANGCKATDSVKVSFTQKSCFYNIVTPNGDGYNDYFDLTDMCPDGVTMEAKIFNEKGTLVASLDEKNPKWDANDPSKPPTGTSSTYTAFVILTKDGQTIAKFGESFSVIYSK
jgi:gliding motility-associated-like protein